MNIKFQFSILSFLLILVASTGYAQDRGVCGMTHEMESMLPFVDQKTVDLYKEANPDRFAEINIPLKMHLVADFNGNGRIARRYALNTLCRLNKDYGVYGITFYLKDGTFSEINNDGIYENPSGNSTFVSSFKDGNAVDIFITENADTGSDLGTTLGYYQPAFNGMGDFIILRKLEVIDSSGTVSHEVGHYFTLRHPHSGWANPYDVDQYGDQVPFFTNPETGQTIELMDGSNCETAGDRLCDTPPDYLLGFTVNNCLNVPNIQDPNGDALVSNPKLHMGYWGGCAKYEFSPQQVDRMKMNIASSARNFLDNTHVPNEDDVTGDLVITTPLQSETIETYNSVEISWEGVENADNYLVEVGNPLDNTDSREYVVDGSTTSLYLTDLREDNPYVINIKPFNDANGCYPAVQVIFFTGSTFTSTEDPAFVNEFIVFPNPSKNGQSIYLNIDSDWRGNANMILTDVSGKVVMNRTVAVDNGSQQINITQNENIDAGVYLLSFATEKGNVTRKIVVQ